MDCPAATPGSGTWPARGNGTVWHWERSARLKTPTRWRDALRRVRPRFGHDGAWPSKLKNHDRETAQTPEQYFPETPPPAYPHRANAWPKRPPQTKSHSTISAHPA